MTTTNAPRGPAIALAAAVMLLASAAEAQSTGSYMNFRWAEGALIGGGIAVAAVAVTDITFTIYNGCAALADRRPSVGIAVAELLLMPPQVAIGLVGVFVANDPTVRVLAGALALWTGALLVHGIYTLVTRNRKSPANRDEERLSTTGIGVSPTVLFAGNSPVPAVSLSIRL